jgi:hypothetical protein
MQLGVGARNGMRAAIGGLCAAVLLASCGLAARQERQEQMTAAVAAKDQGTADCKSQYPNTEADFVARNKCAFQAALVVRPFVTYPDLFDQSWAESAVLAEQLQAKKTDEAISCYRTLTGY